MEKGIVETKLNRALNLFSVLLFAFVKYRIHISLIFFFLLYYNNLRNTSEINYNLILSFSLWHFSLFLFDRIYDRNIDKISQPEEFVKEQHSMFLYLIVAAGLITSFLIYLRSGFGLIYWLILFPITFLYPLEIYKGYRIKSIFFIKNFYSAFFIFSLPLIIQLHLITNGNFNIWNAYKPILSLFIYVLIGEVFWDIRDVKADKMSRTITIPNKFGLIPTKLYMIALILTDAFLTNCFFSTSAIIYLALLIFVKEDTHRLIFHLPPLIALVRFVL
jgi:4-hydroxybenzoate polyprenyltransferase